MDTRKALDNQAVGLMIVVCFIFSTQQIALKLAAADIAPILQIALRSGLSAVLVSLYMAWHKEPFTVRDGSWKPGLWVGLLFGLEYVFLGEALQRTSAAHAVVFLYTSPIFAALLLHFFVPAERMALVQWAGILLAFLGIAIVFLWHSNTVSSSNQRWGDLLALLAGAAWGLTTVIIRGSILATKPPRETLLYQLGMAFLILLLASALSGQLAFKPSSLALTSLAYQTVVISFFASLMWFWLLRYYSASRLGVLSFMTPLFGVVLGAWLLQEEIEKNFLLGAVLVVCGIVLVSGNQWFKQVFKTL